MRRIAIPEPPRPGGVMSPQWMAWVEACFREISNASGQQSEQQVADNYEVIPPATESRSLDAASATLAQTRQVLAQLIHDMQSRGSGQA